MSTLPIPDLIHLALRQLAGLDFQGDVFAQVVKLLADTLGVRVTLVGSIDGDQVVTLAIHHDGAPAPPMSYALAGTPCANLLSAHFCHLVDNVQDAYPHDAMLRDLGSRSYLGMPLQNADGRTIGLLVAIHDQPLAPHEELVGLMRLMAERCQTELQRRLADEQRTAAEHTLAAQVRMLQLAATTARLWIWEYDPRRDRLTWGEGDPRLLSPLLRDGGTRAEFLAAFPPESQSIVNAALDAGLRGQGAPEAILHLQGSDRQVRLVINPGIHRPVLGVLMDVTETQLMAERLRQTEKLEAVGRLAGGIAHDFNNQLTGIMGYAEMLLGRLGDPQQQRWAERILTGSQRAADLTRQLLTYARKGPQDHRPVNLHDLVHEAVALLERTIDPRVLVSTVLEADQPFVLGDASQLANALVNLGLNGRDAMPEGGRLTFATVSSDGWVELTVSDEGLGISPEVRSRLFEPFFTTKPAGQGTGLGLAAVHGTVLSHGGTITVDSAPGHGTRFVLRLPLCQERSEKGSDSDLRRSIRPCSILVVDDEPVAAGLLEDVLSPLGHRLTVFTDPDIALAWFNDHAAEIDLALLDMLMPSCSGLDLLRRLRQRRPDLRAAFISGYSPGEHAAAALAEGAVAVLMKPYSQQQLLSILANDSRSAAGT